MTEHTAVSHARRRRTRARRFASALAILVALTPAFSVAAPPVLSQTLQLPAEGITVRYPDSWSAAPSRYPGAHVLERTTTGPSVLVMITVDAAADHTQALARLADIAAEAPSTFLEIGGWPALQRRYERPPPAPGPSPAPAGAPATQLTTAVAAGSLVVRLEGYLPPDADPAIADEAEAIGRALGFSNTGSAGQLQSDLDFLVGKSPTAFTPVSVVARSSLVSPGLNNKNVNPDNNDNDSEIEIAASTNGMNVVVANNSTDYATSNDGGKNFRPVLQVTTPFSADGDPSLAFGQSGNFYFALIGFPDPRPGPPPTTSCSTTIAVSTDNGQTFQFVGDTASPFRGHATVCPRCRAGTLNAGAPCGPTGGVGGRGCDVTPGDNAGACDVCFPDQEHIAADRFNAGAGGDQVYSVWRDFIGQPGIMNPTCGDAGAPVVPMITCSTDGGTTWPVANAKMVGPMNGDFPRVTVGQDGSVYVVWELANAIRLKRFTSCATGLMPVSDTLVANYAEVSCPIPGLDRCAGQLTPSSPMVAVDDLDPKHVYVAYAFNTANTPRTGAGNDDVRVRDSRDCGLTFPAGRFQQLNAPQTGRRYMPWVCSTCGAALVSWFDRRVDPAQNDLTEYWGGISGLDALGNLVKGPDFKISEVADSACGPGTGYWVDGLSGFHCVPRESTYSESCPRQPQLAGECSSDTNVRCDYSDCGQCSVTPQPCGIGGFRECPPGEVCNTGSCSVAGTPCRVAADCPAGERCDPRAGCQCGRKCALTFRACTMDTDCPLRCSVTTARVCTVNGDCPPGEMCNQQELCNAPQSCLLGRGCPKYGDYNGNACAAGRFFTAWASATAPPPAGTRLPSIDAFFDKFSCVPNADHYLCYNAHDRNSPPQHPDKVDLTDAFQTGAFKPGHAQRFCTPANKNDEGVNDSATHLKSYELQTIVAPPVQATVNVVNQFGKLTFRLGKPANLVVPSSKGLMSPPSPPDPTAPGFEHFLCYKVRTVGPRLPKNIIVEVSDQFGAGKYVVRRPSRLCTPVAKKRPGMPLEPIRNPLRQLVCYSVGPIVPIRPPDEVFANNQFGDERLGLGREKELCVPSLASPVVSGGCTTSTTTTTTSTTTTTT